MHALYRLFSKAIISDTDHSPLIRCVRLGEYWGVVVVAAGPNSQRFTRVFGGSHYNAADENVPLVKRKVSGG